MPTKISRCKEAQFYIMIGDLVGFGYLDGIPLTEHDLSDFNEKTKCEILLEYKDSNKKLKDVG